MPLSKDDFLMILRMDSFPLDKIEKLQLGAKKIFKKTVKDLDSVGELKPKGTGTSRAAKSQPSH